MSPHRSSLPLQDTCPDIPARPPSWIVPPLLNLLHITGHHFRMGDGSDNLERGTMMYEAKRVTDSGPNVAQLHQRH